MVSSDWQYRRRKCRQQKILELYYDTTKQDANDDIKEITIYSNGEYVSFFTTSPGGVKQNYKTNIDIAELIDK